jgi:formylglycine-generating enzyme required for sulfatase activity
MLREYAWFRDNARLADEDYAHPVGWKKPNSWGLHDMHGNVFEWCRDTYRAKRPDGCDPEATEAGPFRVYRGGCWFCDARGCASSFRLFDSPDEVLFGFGLRVAVCPVPEVAMEA